MNNTQDYMVSDVHKVARFIEDEIGVEYQIEQNNGNRSAISRAGEIDVFELTQDEHLAIRKYIDDNNLWDKEYVMEKKEKTRMDVILEETSRLCVESYNYPDQMVDEEEKEPEVEEQEPTPTPTPDEPEDEMPMNNGGDSPAEDPEPDGEVDAPELEPESAPIEEPEDVIEPVEEPEVAEEPEVEAEEEGEEPEVEERDPNTQPLNSATKGKLRNWLVTNDKLTKESVDGLIAQTKLDEEEAYNYIFKVASKLLRDRLENKAE